jgi:hypothetical protein
MLHPGTSRWGRNFATPDPPIVTILEPLIPRSATHGPGRGTVISLKLPPDGHEGVGTPLIAVTFFSMEFVRLGAAMTAAFFAAAIAGVDPSTTRHSSHSFFSLSDQEMGHF